MVMFNILEWVGVFYCNTIFDVYVCKENHTAVVPSEQQCKQINYIFLSVVLHNTSFFRRKNK